MYQLISAIGKPAQKGSRWVNINIADLPLSVIFKMYTTVYVKLSNGFLPTPVSVSLDIFRTEYSQSAMTFTELLTANGNKTLTSLDKEPVINTRYAKYADAFHAGYFVEPIHHSASSDATMPMVDKTWLHLTRPGLDYSLFYKNCLVNVNGFFHLTDVDDHGVYVVDGMTTSRISKKNNVGIYSFREVGELTLLPITREMIYKQTPDQLFKDRCYIDTGKDLSNKTVMLVLGGYLHALDPMTFTRVTDSAFCVDFGNLPFIERLYESGSTIDLKSLHLEKSPANPTQTSVSNYTSDETIRAYLTLSQSFFVILDNPEIFVETRPVESAKLPNRFISYEPPRYPLLVGTGKCVNYWYTQETGQFVISSDDTMRSNRLFKTITVSEQTSVSDSRIPDNPVSYGNASFLVIGTDL
jgi:hypothetical protein